MLSLVLNNDALFRDADEKEDAGVYDPRIRKKKIEKGRNEDGSRKS